MVRMKDYFYNHRDYCNWEDEEEIVRDDDYRHFFENLRIFQEESENAQGIIAKKVA